MSFEAEIQAALSLLGAAPGDRVVDFLVDPGSARRALDDVKEGAGLVIRAMPAHAPANEGYGPAPVDPVWIRIMRGEREIGTAELRGGDGMVRRATRVEIDEGEEGCCDAVGCTKKRGLGSVWLVVEGAAKGAGEERLLIAEERVAEGEPKVARGVAASLAAALGVPVHRGGEAVEIEAGEAPPALGEPLDAALLARYSLRTEGSRVVLRDWDSLGPRATAKRNAWIGAAVMIVAAGAWALFAWQMMHGTQGAKVGAAMGAALLTLTGYAFVGVAQFSSKYRARSAPLVWVGRDKLTVMPWVGRDGAVDARPEGRFGAAIPLADVRSVSVTESVGGVAVRLATDHGPFDAVVCPTEPVAELLSAALDRAIEEARHPRAGATARQRFRARATAAA
jgi:hypothetical protein